MGKGIVQPSFTSGELSPSLYGRIDFARYYTGLKTCKNFIVRQFGGVSNRPGTRFVSEVVDSTKRSRLIPFEFSTSQAYVLEFSHLKMRIIKDGGVVVWPSGVDEGEPVEVVTPWAEADLPRLKFTQSADVMTLCHPEYATRQLSRTDHHLWTLTEFDTIEGPFQDINVDEAKTIISSAPEGNVTLTANVDLFQANHIGLLVYLEQSPDDSTKKWEVQKTMVINDVRRAGSGYYQAVTAGKTGTVRPSITEGSESDGDPGVKWNYLHSGFGIAKITGFTDATHVTATVVKRIPDNACLSGATKTVVSVVAGTFGDEFTSETFAKVRVNNHRFPSGEKVTLTNVTPQLNGSREIQVIDSNWFYVVGVVSTNDYGGGGTAALSTASLPTYKWAFEAWGGDAKYPGTTNYFQQRQCFAGVYGKPQTVWMSRTIGFNDFGTSIPILDEDGVTFTLNSRRANEIRHFVELSELILLTSDGPFLIRGNGQDGVLAPGKILTKRQGSSGASHIPPVIINNHALYIQEKGNQVRSLGYSFESDAFIGNDLTVISGHLFYGKELVEWAYQSVPFSTVWAIRDDGALLGFTYMPEHEVAGWHRHETDGAFESVAVISEGNEDVVYFVVRRTIDGVEKRYVERLAPRFFTSSYDYFFVDCGLTYDGRNTDAEKKVRISGGTSWDYTDSLTIETDFDLFVVGDIGDEIQITEQITTIVDGKTITVDGEVCKYRITAVAGLRSATVAPNRIVPTNQRNLWLSSWSIGRSTFSGLGHLEGKTVAILADGNVHPEQVVTGGAVNLESCASVVHAGLPYIADLETLDLSSTQQNIRDKVQNINRVTMIVEESRGIFAGPDADHLTEWKPRSDEGYSQNAKATTGIVNISITSTWSKGGRVLVRQSYPLPLSILSVTPEVTVGGS